MARVISPAHCLTTAIVTTMADLARKIERKYWNRAADLPNEVPAETLIDLKARGNTLSFWLCDRSDTSSIERAALAVASTWDRLDDVDMTWVKEADLVSDAIEVIASEGDSLFSGSNALHRDAAKLTATKLCKIAERIINEYDLAQTHRVPAFDVANKLLAAIENEEIEPTKLHPKLKGKLIEMAKKYNIETKLT